MLSYVESVNFLKEQLQIKNAESLLSEDKYRLLCDLTRRLHEHSPFHNFFLMAQDLDKRQKPDWDDIKYRMLSGAGGLCYPRNVFTFYLLRALGFDVIFVMAKVLGSPVFDHVAVVARDVRQVEDRYLVDTGFCWPTFEPIDLGFVGETPEFLQSHFIIKYVKTDGNMIRLQRHTKVGSITYTRLYEMCLGECNPEQVDKYMDSFYTPSDPQSFVLHRVLCCSQYDEAGQMRIIQDNRFKIDTAGQNVEKFHLHEDDSLINCTLENFPGLSKSIVLKALANWRKVCPFKSDVIFPFM